MKRFLFLLCFPVFAGPSSADVAIEYVTVGNVGNTANSDGFGAVGYEYQISKNETTIAQYAEFLNAVAKADPYGLYDSDMTYSRINGISRKGVSGAYLYEVNLGSENKPITCVSWFDAARFCNWLHNGQPTGSGAASSTETGAYTLNGAVSGVSVNKNANAKVWIPTENEWYKAAYYDPTKGSGGYWLYPSRRDTTPSNDLGVAGGANFYDNEGYTVFHGGTSWALTDVGAFGESSASYYGTNDQGGSVYEWNDAVIYVSRGLRGGAWGSTESMMRSTARADESPASQGYDLGFRVASSTADVLDPKATISAAPAGITEASAKNIATITVKLGRPAPDDIAVGLSYGGTAILGKDYSTKKPVSVTIKKGSDTGVFTLKAKDDALVEPVENITISLRRGAGYRLGKTKTAEVRVTSDDKHPEIMIAAAPKAIHESAEEFTRITLTLDKPTPKELRVNLSYGGAATNQKDYNTPKPESVVVKKGASTASFKIAAINDKKAESNEKITVTLAPGARYRVGKPSVATVTIRSDE